MGGVYTHLHLCQDIMCNEGALSISMTAQKRLILAYEIDFSLHNMEVSITIFDKLPRIIVVKL
jgi:hypothetical protein